MIFYLVLQCALGSNVDISKFKKKLKIVFLIWEPEVCYIHLKKCFG